MAKTLHATFSLVPVAERHHAGLLHPIVLQGRLQSLKHFWKRASAELMAPREEAVQSLMRRIREEGLFH